MGARGTESRSKREEADGEDAPASKKKTSVISRAGNCSIL